MKERPEFPELAFRFPARISGSHTSSMDSQISESFKRLIDKYLKQQRVWKAEAAAHNSKLNSNTTVMIKPSVALSESEQKEYDVLKNLNTALTELEIVHAVTSGNSGRETVG